VAQPSLFTRGTVALLTRRFPDTESLGSGFGIDVDEVKRSSKQNELGRGPHHATWN
jgi:hypothetical protein